MPVTIKPSHIAIIADIHGNTLALEKCLADIGRQGGVDAFWFLGDYVAIGPDPLAVLERLENLNDATYIYGNTDRMVLEMESPWPVTDKELATPGFIDLFGRVNRSFGWTAGAVSTAGWRPWLASLPLDVRLNLPDGTRVLLVHASPGTDDGTGLHPYQPEEERRRLLSGADADLVLVGHTHVHLDFTLDGIRVVNPSSVSNPLPPDLRAAYAILHVGHHGHKFTFHQVDYDHEQVITLAAARNHPALDYITAFQRGRRRPTWLPEDDRE